MVGEAGCDHFGKGWGHGFAGKVEYAQLLNDASEVFMKGPEDWQKASSAPERQTLTLTLPVKKPDVTVPVVELFMK